MEGFSVPLGGLHLPFPVLQAHLTQPYAARSEIFGGPTPQKYNWWEMALNSRKTVDKFTFSGVRDQPGERRTPWTPLWTLHGTTSDTLTPTTLTGNVPAV